MSHLPFFVDKILRQDIINAKFVIKEEGKMWLKAIFIGIGVVLLSYIWLVFLRFKITGKLIQVRAWRHQTLLD